MAANGVVFAAGKTNIGRQHAPNGRSLQAAVGQMLELAGGNNGWLGGLADLAIWNCALSSTDSTGTNRLYSHLEQGRRRNGGALQHADVWARPPGTARR